MNLLKFLPKKLKESYEKNIANTGTKTPSDEYITKLFFIGIFISIALSIVIFFLVKISPILIFLASFLVIQVIFYFWVSLNASTRIKKIEDVFPDFIQLMSSNLRAGMTVDYAFLSSARPELAPLDIEILRTGREIATGKDIVYAFSNMAERVGSEKISKIIGLIISGLKAGGNIATLLENTAGNIKNF